MKTQVAPFVQRTAATIALTVAAVVPFAASATVVDLYGPGNSAGIGGSTTVAPGDHYTVQGSQYNPPASFGVTMINPGAVTETTTGAQNGTAFTATAGTGGNGTVAATTSGGGIVNGSSPQVYAAPVAYTGNPITTNYFSTGGVPNSITFTFSTAQAYFGLLWGSIGTGDTITFYSAGAQVAQVSGAEGQSAATGFNGQNGARGAGGSQYTLINFLNGATFTSVVLSQTAGPSFEFAQAEYATKNIVPVPEPESLALLGIGIAGIALARRRQARN